MFRVYQLYPHLSLSLSLLHLPQMSGVNPHMQHQYGAGYSQRSHGAMGSMGPMGGGGPMMMNQGSGPMHGNMMGAAGSMPPGPMNPKMAMQVRSIPN